MISKSLKEHLEWFTQDLIKRINTEEYETELKYDSPMTFLIIGRRKDTSDFVLSFYTSSMTFNGSKKDYEEIIRKDILSLFKE